jgi:preprotein translocase subunit SecG
MLKQIWFIISIFLILIIFLRVPQESVGLSSFATKTDLLGSPSSAQRSLNILTAFAILVYFAIAIKLNLIGEIASVL